MTTPPQPPADRRFTVRDAVFIVGVLGFLAGLFLFDPRAALTGSGALLMAIGVTR